MMRTITEPDEMRDHARAARLEGKSIGFVPTMGALHEGHASLLRRARRECGYVVASILVNPAQFGPSEDLAAYPRTPDADIALLERIECDALFHPDAAAMYPEPYRTWVDVEGLDNVLCGASRPGHFRGVATVVLKLIHIVEPDVAWFGQKDAQQAALIAAMARDLNLACRIERAPTVREPDGLAMSSRNVFLSPAERAAAPTIFRALRSAQQAHSGGERTAEMLLDRARGVIAAEPLLSIDYLELVDPDDLTALNGSVTGPALLAVAVRVGSTRLIDNIVLQAGN